MEGICASWGSYGLESHVPLRSLPHFLSPEILFHFPDKKVLKIGWSLKVRGKRLRYDSDRLMMETPSDAI